MSLISNNRPQTAARVWFLDANANKPPKDAGEIKNSEDSDQQQSDLGLHCFMPRLVCLKTYIQYFPKD